MEFSSNRPAEAQKYQTKISSYISSSPAKKKVVLKLKWWFNSLVWYFWTSAYVFILRILFFKLKKNSTAKKKLVSFCRFCDLYENEIQVWLIHPEIAEKQRKTPNSAHGISNFWLGWVSSGWRSKRMTCFNSQWVQTPFEVAFETSCDFTNYFMSLQF